MLHRISSLHWNQVPLTFQQPKHHFIVSSGESHKSGKLTVDLRVPIVHPVVVQKDGSTGFSTKARKSGNGTFGVSWHFPSLSCLSLESRVLHFVFLGPTATSALQQSTSLYLNLRSKTTCRFLKSRVWLKPGVGRTRRNPLPELKRTRSYSGGFQTQQMPFELQFCISFSALKSLLAAHLRRLKNAIYSI